MKFCPICFRKDKVPYFIQSLVYIFVTIFQEHNCFYIIHVLNVIARFLLLKCIRMKKVFCIVINVDLIQKIKKTNFKRKFIIWYTCSTKINGYFKKGYIKFEDRWVYSFLFFITIMQITKLIFLRKHSYFINQNPLFKMLKIS